MSRGVIPKSFGTKILRDKHELASHESQQARWLHRGVDLGFNLDTTFEAARYQDFTLPHASMKPDQACFESIQAFGVPCSVTLGSKTLNPRVCHRRPFGNTTRFCMSLGFKVYSMSSFIA